MTKPLFEVGEEVILQSRAYPQFNGSYIVEDSYFKSDVFFYTCPWTGSRMHGHTLWVYKLEGLYVKIEATGDTLCSTSEASLRKKHEPADDEFIAELHSMLNSNHKVKQVDVSYDNNTNK